MEGKKCAVCGHEGLKVCSGCHTIRYCSKEHQKSHWKEHKNSCKSFTVESDPKSGHYLMASKDITPGSIILQEDPLVFGPMNDNGVAMCLGCCRNLNGKGVGCPHCSWPMCGRKECFAEGSQHVQGECALLDGASHRIVAGNYAQSVTSEVYHLIMVLRCLSLLKRNPAKWEKLMKLKEYGDPNCDRSAIVKLVDQWLPEAGVKEEWIVKICNAFDFGKSFELSDSLGNGCEGVKGLYSFSDLCNDFLIPNATLTFSKEGRIVVRASVLIAKGAKIIVNYAREIRFGNTNRTKQFQQMRSVLEAQDLDVPIELNALTHGIYCLKCPNLKGTLRPSDPLYPMVSCNWVCDICSDRTSAAFIANITDRVNADLDRLNRDSIPECEAFISKYQKILIPFHDSLTNTRLDIVLNYGKLQNPDVDKWEAVTREILASYDVTSPGLNRSRGSLRFHLYTALTAKLKKLSSVRRNLNTAYEVLSCLQSTAETLKEIITIFSWESEHTVENRLAGQLRQKLAQVESVIEGRK